MKKNPQPEQTQQKLAGELENGGSSPDSRKLTAAEERRLAAFEQLSHSLQSQGYTQTPLTMGIVAANVFAIAFSVPFIVLFGALFVALNHKGLNIDFSLSGFLLFMLVYVVLIVVHELIHGITWAAFAKNHFADIEFGFIKEYLTPYCTCKTPLGKGDYMLGAAMPCIVLGFIPSIVSVITGSLSWLLMGLIMIMSAGGDAAAIWQILKHRTKARDVLYIDHPTQLGGVVFER